MVVHHVTGRTGAEATESFRQALTRAADGDTIELDYGIECQGPFLIWSRIGISGHDSGAHTLYATTSPVVSIGAAGVTLENLAVHYVGAGEGVAIQAVAGVRPALVNVDIEGQVIFAGSAMRKEDARPQPVAATPLDFGTIETPDHALALVIHNPGSASWKYTVQSENFLHVTPAAGCVHPDQTQTLQVTLQPDVIHLPPERWLDFPAGVQLTGSDITLAVPVRLFYQPPPQLTRLPLKQGVLHLDMTPVIFLPGSNTRQSLTRRLLNDTAEPVRLTLAVPNWLEVTPPEVVAAPHETIPLLFRLKAASVPAGAKALRGIVTLQDASGATLTMIAAAFDYQP